MRAKGYKCNNVKCDRCVGHSMCGELGDIALNCIDRIITRQTNADRIRAMSDEKLAEFIKNVKVRAAFCKSIKNNDAFEELCSAEWLQQPAEGE